MGGGHYTVIITHRVSTGGNAVASIHPSVCFQFYLNSVTFDLNLFMTRAVLRWRSKVKVKCWNAVGGTSVVSQGQFSSSNSQDVEYNDVILWRGWSPQFAALLWVWCTVCVAGLCESVGTTVWHGVGYKSEWIVERQLCTECFSAGELLACHHVISALCACTQCSRHRPCCSRMNAVISLPHRVAVD